MFWKTKNKIKKAGYTSIFYSLTALLTLNTIWTLSSVEFDDHIKE